MRRANRDWFSLEDEDNLPIPVFHNSHDEFCAWEPHNSQTRLIAG